MKYRWNARRRHGVHSPFIYELTDQCFGTAPDHRFKECMKFLENHFGYNASTIEITDHGVGSKRLGTTRKLNAIYRTSSSRGKYGLLLHQLMRYYGLSSALELGTSLGIGTTCLSTGNGKARITTIEGCPNTFKEAQKAFEAMELNSIHGIQSTFSEVIPNLEGTFDLIFIDGHHDGEALLSYLNALIQHAHSDTFFVLDDIRWSDSMKSAWETLLHDPRFHVTIDLFRMGIVLLRPQQEKEHFVIRP